jgi:hypothetical protein
VRLLRRVSTEAGAGIACYSDIRLAQTNTKRAAVRGTAMAAVATFGYIASVALTNSPLGLVARL